MRVLNSCAVQQVSNWKPWVFTIQAHTFSARLLFDETFAQPDVCTVANCSVTAFSVFCSSVVMRSLIFLQLVTALTWRWVCFIPLFQRVAGYFFVVGKVWWGYNDIISSNRDHMPWSLYYCLGRPFLYTFELSCLCICGSFSLYQVILLHAA